jgi:hypothetical protein
MVILGSHRAAVELFEKRGANVSDRPQTEMTKLYVPSCLILLSGAD